MVVVSLGLVNEIKSEMMAGCKWLGYPVLQGFE
jgi:hypothetical protein